MPSVLIPFLLAQAAATASAPAPPSGAETLDVAIRAADRTLWRGPLTVAPEEASGWSQSRYEPAPHGCPRGRDASESVSIRMVPQPSDDGTLVMAVTVRWTHAGDAPCAPSRAVELSQAVAFDGGGLVTLRGNDGLVVDLRRS